jgi:hypothetical protein
MVLHHKSWQIENHPIVSFVSFEVFVRTLPGDSILEDSRRISHQARQEHKEHKVFSSPFSGQHQIVQHNQFNQ